LSPSAHLTVDAARALEGPDWLTARRMAAAEQLDSLEWPTDSEEIWRYSRIKELDLDRFRPLTMEELGPVDAEPVPGGGPVAAEAGERSGLIVVRDGRVVHHELDDVLASKGVEICGLATCDAQTVGRHIGTASDSSPDAYTVLHDAFLAGGAFIHVPRGVVVDRPVVVLHWSEGEGVASFPHTLVVAEESSEVTIVERFGSPDVEHFVDGVVELLVGDAAHVKHLSVQEHGPKTWSLMFQRAHIGRTRP